jgi:hypothetical protein
MNLRPYRELTDRELGRRLTAASFEATDERLMLAARKRARTLVWALWAERMARAETARSCS